MFPALTALAARCGYDEVIAGSYYDHHIEPCWRALEYVYGDAETLVHELCHWATATPDERLLPNLGMEGWSGEPCRQEEAASEVITTWLELRAYEAAGVEWCISEDADGEWQHDADLLKLTEETAKLDPRWRNVPPWFREALAEAIRADLGSPRSA